MFSLIPWTERHRLADFRSDVDSIFDEFFGRNMGMDIGPWGVFKFRSPAVDMEENDKEIIVKAEIPGLEPDDFEISLDKNELTIKGEKREEKKEDRKNYHMTERCYGSFYRSIPLPSEVDSDKVKASYNKGILEISLPKSETHQAKKITVNVK
ncbi:MAG: Hsp20/alpha crystallin family protein [bacterium]